MKVYLDNNATTKVDEEVVKAMMPYFSDYYGTPLVCTYLEMKQGLQLQKQDKLLLIL